MGSGFEISVRDVLRIVQAMDALLSDFGGSTQAVSGVTIPVSSYGQVGSAAAGSTTTAQNQLVMTLQVLAKVLTTINKRVQESANGYADCDSQFARILAELAAAERTAFRKRR